MTDNSPVAFSQFLEDPSDESSVRQIAEESVRKKHIFYASHVELSDILNT